MATTEQRYGCMRDMWPSCNSCHGTLRPARLYPRHNPTKHPPTGLFAQTTTTTRHKRRPFPLTHDSRSDRVPTRSHARHCCLLQKKQAIGHTRDIHHIIIRSKSFESLMTLLFTSVRNTPDHPPFDDDTKVVHTIRHSL